MGEQGNCSWEQMPHGGGTIVLQVSEVPLRGRWQLRDALIVSNTAVLVENRKLLFKQMASLSIHNQAFNEIKRSRQGCRYVSPDHFGRHQLNCISIFVKSVPRCPPCPLFYLPSFFILFFFVSPAFLVWDHDQMDISFKAPSAIFSIGNGNGKALGS